MYRMNGNPGSLAPNRRLPEAAPRLQSVPSVPSRRIRPAKTRGRRRDDATFIAIAALLAILFVTQVGWVIEQQADPQTGISRSR
jgi:hypothetical protein